MNTVNLFPADFDPSNGDVETRDLWGYYAYHDAHEVWPTLGDYLISHGGKETYDSGTDTVTWAPAVPYLTEGVKIRGTPGNIDGGATTNPVPVTSIVTTDVAAPVPVIVSWVGRLRVVKATATFGTPDAMYPQGRVLGETRDPTATLNLTATLYARVTDSDEVATNDPTLNRTDRWRAGGPPDPITFPVSNNWSDVSIPIPFVTSIPPDLRWIYAKLTVPAATGEPDGVHYDIDVDTAIFKVQVPDLPNLTGALRAAHTLFSPV